MDRRSELSQGLAETRARIAEACSAHSRDEAEVTLIVVTKYFPASDVRLLHELGVRDVGESRHPEAQDKRGECADLDLTWHFIGRLQSNKASAIGAYADVVHSVDRLKVVAGLARAARERATPLRVLAQVSLDGAGDTDRGGVHPGDLDALIDEIERQEALELTGVMAVAPLDADPSAAFARLARAADGVRARAPQATWISAGMSGDLEAAIGAGATHVRVGAAILGSRPGRR